jgi:hypothetical protein
LDTFSSDTGARAAGLAPGCGGHYLSHRDSVAICFSQMTYPQSAPEAFARSTTKRFSSAVERYYRSLVGRGIWHSYFRWKEYPLRNNNLLEMPGTPGFEVGETDTGW